MAIRSVLDSDLLKVRDNILRLASLVNQATARAIEAFYKHDIDLAQEVVNGDDELDSVHHRLEQTIVTTVALQQPMAADLRKLIAALLITNELERMGDHAEGIAQTVLRRSDEASIDIPPSLSLMRATVDRMLQAVMDAYVAEDPEQAKAAAKIDDEMDELYQRFFEEIVENMGTGRLPIEQGTYLLWAGHNLERIGDRVTNICERIVYARTGNVGELNPKPDED
jgi:phosphate transport system protein